MATTARPTARTTARTTARPTALSNYYPIIIRDFETENPQY